MPVRWLVAGAAPMQVSRYLVAAGAVVTPHVHTGKIEYWLVVRGEGSARIGDQLLQVREGDIVATVPGVPHSLRNDGTGPLEFVNFVQPTGEPITTTELPE
jgi:mannose-6-phosphate isomerase-like protein (cupin superfamily)